MAVAQEQEVFVSAFREMETEGLGGPPWVQELRRAALERFAERGFPSRKEEDWKYSDVSPIARRGFRRAIGNGVVTASGFSANALLDIEGARLGFVNGVGQQALCRPAPRGTRVARLAEAVSAETDLEDYLGRWAATAGNGFVALNTAFLTDGAVVRVPRGTAVGAPIHLVFLSHAEALPAMTHPRTLIVLDPGAEATVIETYLGEGEYWTNAVTEIVLGDGAVLQHCKLMLEGEQAFHVATTQVCQERDSSFRSFSLAMGGQWARNDLNVVLAAEGASCALDGLFVATGGQHVDNHTLIDHAHPRGTSRQLYKGVLGGSATGVFNGKIMVRRDAQRTDAEQTNKNLLLSEKATVDTKPQLEIFADDVRCTHGAAVGQLDSGGLFYLQSRGLPRQEASALLTCGFAADVLARQPSASVRTVLETLVSQRVRGAFEAGEMV